MAKTYLCGTPREVRDGEGERIQADGFSQAAEAFARRELLRYGPHPVERHRKRVFVVSDGNETFMFRTLARPECVVSTRWERDWKP